MLLTCSLERVHHEAHVLNGRTVNDGRAAPLDILFQGRDQLLGDGQVQGLRGVEEVWAIEGRDGHVGVGEGEGLGDVSPAEKEGTWCFVARNLRSYEILPA